MLERFPLTAELKRWENRGKMMEERESRGMKTTMRTMESAYRQEVEPEVPSAPSGDLVNFPKYLLLNDCHLKQLDIQRYVKEEAAARESAKTLRQSGSTIGAPSSIGAPSTQTMGESSKGASLTATLGMRPAGSLMPTGRNQKSSNPFR